VRQSKATFGHHLDEIAQARLVTQVPRNAQDDDFAIEMPTFEHPVNLPLLARLFALCVSKP
jgi:hypothetical protein